MGIEGFLTDFKLFFNDILISGVNYIPMSIIKKLNKYFESSKKYNLLTLASLIEKFINQDNLRGTLFVDISIWLDIAIIECENFSAK